MTVIWKISLSINKRYLQTNIQNTIVKISLWQQRDLLRILSLVLGRILTGPINLICGCHSQFEIC